MKVSQRVQLQSITRQIAKTREEILFILVSCRLAGAGNPGRSRLFFVSRSEFVFDKSALAQERTREKGSRKDKRRRFRTGAHFLSPERPLHSFSTLNSKTFYLYISSFSYLCLCLSLSGALRMFVRSRSSLSFCVGDGASIFAN